MIYYHIRKRRVYNRLIHKDGQLYPVNEQLPLKVGVLAYYASHLQVFDPGQAAWHLTYWWRPYSTTIHESKGTVYLDYFYYD